MENFNIVKDGFYDILAKAAGDNSPLRAGKEHTATELGIATTNKNGGEVAKAYKDIDFKAVTA